MTRLVRDVSAGIRVLQIRDGILLSESQILERARNIVMGLVGNYRIETLDRVERGGRAERRAPSGEVRAAGGDSVDEQTASTY
jgi:hypothetical protein